MTASRAERRRSFVLASGAIGVGLLLGGCEKGDEEASATGPHEYKPKEVAATEDLLREHGVLRRALLVDAEGAARPCREPASVPAGALHETAMLFRRFGEDYHERILEERFVFPAMRQAGGPARRYVDVLIAQHNRGRDITDFESRRAGPHARGRRPALAGARLLRVDV